MIGERASRCGGFLMASLLAALPALVLSGGVTANVARADTVVQFNLNGQINGTSGIIDSFQVQLYDSLAPVTVANFLSYVTDNVYDDTIIHRDVPGFVVQGGGFVPYVEVVNGQNTITALNPVISNGAIQNEYSATRSNLRGTIAMAKIGSDPNSATNQWFINLTDNSANLDNQNGGFTVFGQVFGEGMKLVDAASSLPQYNLNPYYDPNFNPAYPSAGPFAQVPLFNNGSTFVVVTSVATVAGPAPGVYWAPAATGGQGAATDHWTSTSAKWASGPDVSGSGSHKIDGTPIFAGTAGTVTVDGTVGVAKGMTFSTTGYNIAAGTAAIVRLTGIAADNVITTDSGVTAAISARLDGTAGMTKSGRGALVLSGANTYTGITTVAGGTLELGTAAFHTTTPTSAFTTFLGTSGDRADVKAGKLVFDYTSADDNPADTIKAILAASYGTSGQTPFAQANGGKIYTTGNSGRALGWADDTAAKKVTVMYTLFGDATLDGTVNFDDLNKVLTSYNQPGTWATGDFTYDGNVNFDDLNKVLTAYNTSLGSGETISGAALDAQAIGMLSGSGFTVVPEPSSLVLLLAGVTGLLAYGWRKRQ